MIDKLRTQSVLIFRILVLSLAVGFWVYQFKIADLTHFGIHFRFLTNWTLTFNVLVAMQMLTLSLRWSEKRWDGFVGLVIVMNIAVVVQYWRLFFIDPALVQSNGTIPWYREYYIHALGPILMWLDAFLIFGAFRRVFTSCVLAVVVGVIYPIWIELAIKPMNALPLGKVTNGLPYPFLNDLEFATRAVYYVTSSIVNLVFIGLGYALSLPINRRFNKKNRQY